LRKTEQRGRNGERGGKISHKAPTKFEKMAMVFAVGFSPAKMQIRTEKSALLGRRNEAKRWGNAGKGGKEKGVYPNPETIRCARRFLPGGAPKRRGSSFVPGVQLRSRLLPGGERSEKRSFSEKNLKRGPARNAERWVTVIFFGRLRKGFYFGGGRTQEGEGPTRGTGERKTNEGGRSSDRELFKTTTGGRKLDGGVGRRFPERR